ncbi:MAG: Ig-like domain-containing protein [Bacteroidales bacterium]|nr:Ig-like domain-containing protein [Bacteroidales bacterium]
MMGKLRNLTPLLIAVAALVPTFFMHSCANTTQSPSGGPKDTIPPALYWTKPVPGSVNIPTHGAKFEFGFDEYVKVKTATNIFLSPPQKKVPKSKIQGKSVIVWFEEDLLPNTTYTLNFTDAIADNNEGNMFPGYAYVFSTGPVIDSLMITGTVLDYNTLQPAKNATVMLYKDHSDSAVFKSRPAAAVKTDDWGYFALPYLEDTLYRIYAIKDENNDNMYQMETEQIAFIDSLIHPVTVVNDTLKELQKYDMKDTLECRARESQYTLKLFKEEPTRQFLKNHGRTAERYAFVSFMAKDAWIDSLWIKGYKADRLITQFNLRQDSLEIWINDRRPVPDTLQIYVNYRKTNDSTQVLEPVVEHYPLFIEGALPRKQRNDYNYRKNLKHEDTICVFKLEAQPDLVEQEGFSLTFTYPIIYENFDSVKFHYLNPKQKDIKGEFTVTRDTLDLRKYKLMPKEKLLPGYEYFMKVPHRAFRDINGFYSDSTEVKVSLPTDEKLSTLIVNLEGVSGRLIVDLLNEKRDKVLRTYTVSENGELVFPYLKKGKYSIRITEDVNWNSMIDTGDLLSRKMPENVNFFKMDDGQEYIDIPEAVELSQTINVPDLIKQ